MDDVKEILVKYSSIIKKEIDDSLSNIIPKDLNNASIHLTNAGGKMLRPSLALLTAQVVGGQEKDGLKVGAAIELIHTFSLIHDDIMDDDDVRRGQAAVHKVWGEPLAILSGDILFSKAFELVVSSKDSLGCDKIVNSLDTIAEACIKICEGQALDMGFEGNFDVNEDDYLDMIFMKTAALIAAATKIGAIAGGANDNEIEILYDYGRLIGLAFQIHDDYLDLTSDEDSLGKPIGSDIAEGKMTLIVVNALEKANNEDKEVLLKILKDENNSDEDIKIAMDLFNKYESIDYANKIAKRYVEDAKNLLDVFDDSDAKNILKLIADFVLIRDL
ncbi:MAG: polyprenyl synthetase family protein [Methanobrevibacter sp.]|jgi:geranylgeranyl diphosphate synthase type I|nr:polyprenyl synthetase family protein [Candidatus Methanoflexus mossambicus]